MKKHIFKRVILLYRIKVILFRLKGNTLIMAKNPKQVCLSDEDARLLKIALKKYNMKESPFLKRIISDWLFSNKLQLEQK